MRIFYLLKKELIEIFRQKEMLVIMFIAPILQTIILGYVITTDVNNIPVEVINLSKNKAAYRIVNRINRSDLFDVKKITNRPGDHIKTFKQGKAKSIIILRDSYDKKRKPLAYPEIQILMDVRGTEVSGEVGVFPIQKRLKQGLLQG